MTNLWSFLLQTLTASGVAVLLLVVKGMFRDKLSPRWQFSVWGVLALVLLVPAGLGGRYALANWTLLLETLRSTLSGHYGTLTQVIAPVPLPSLTMPGSVEEWLYVIYVTGVAVLLFRYLFVYLRLRLALWRSHPEADPRVQAAAQQYGLRACPVVRVPDLTSAFICGVSRPVLALPAETEPDEKVLLHELMHLKYHDAAWGLLICFLRCLHWCNPLLWICANLAQNDMESLCDQRVLERLEGEERRAYGHILLDMADERYARFPGTSSMANGVKNIRRRIQAIARFKKYPAGMRLVSVCVILALTVPLLVGVRGEIAMNPRVFPFDETKTTAVMAKARTLRCSTPDGAVDCYAKAVLTGKADFRAICAPLSEQDSLAEEYQESGGFHATSWTSLQLPGIVLRNEGYDVFNFFPDGKDAYTCLLGVHLSDSFDPVALSSEFNELLAVQPLRVEKLDVRWVVLPQGEFQVIETQYPYNQGIKEHVPVWTYEAKEGDFTLQVKVQTSAYVGTLSSTESYPQLCPQPYGTFTSVCTEDIQVIYTGTEAGKKTYSKIDISYRPIAEGKQRPKLSTLDGRRDATPGIIISRSIPLTGNQPSAFSIGGNIIQFYGDFSLPGYYAADLYLDDELTAELTLLPKGGPYD